MIPDFAGRTVWKRKKEEDEDWMMIKIFNIVAVAVMVLLAAVEIDCEKRIGFWQECPQACLFWLQQL